MLSAFVDLIYIDVDQTYRLTKREAGGIYLSLITSAQLVVLVKKHVTYMKKKTITF